MNNQTSSLEFSHFPVMLNEILKISSPSTREKFIDCTFGGGGYSKEILKFSKTNVLAIDRDKRVLTEAKKLEKKYPKRFKFNQSKFSQLETISINNVDVVIFDLGLSSIQLNNFARGFSFSSKESLDMSMGLSDISAADVVNTFSENKLKLIIKILGEEKEASKIAKNIIKSRKIKKITKVDQLVEIIEKSKIKKFKKKRNKKK